MFDLAWAALAAATIVAAPTNGEPLTFSSAENLPLPALARSVGETLASSIVEVGRPQPDSAGPLRLATRPRDTGFYGLCEAAWIDIEFHVTVDAQGEVVSRDGADGFSSRPVFRMIGPAAPVFTSRQQMDATDAAMAASCPRQKGVLGFFEAPDATDASIAAQVVETLAAEGATKTPLPFRASCRDLAKSCEKVRAEWSRLRSSGIIDVKEGHCATESERCVKIFVTKNAEDRRGDLWVISAAVVDADAEARLTDVTTYQRIRIKRLIVREGLSGSDLPL